MSLKEVVLEIAQEMEEYARDRDNAVVRSFAKQLRLVVKASEGQSQTSTEAFLRDSKLPPEVLNAIEIQREREVIRKTAEGERKLRGMAGEVGKRKVETLGGFEFEHSGVFKETSNPHPPQPPVEDADFNMVELVGGHAGESDKPVFLNVPTFPTLGARVVSAGEVFVMRMDGKMHYDEQLTEKVREGREDE